MMTHLLSASKAPVSIEEFNLYIMFFIMLVLIYIAWSLARCASGIDQMVEIQKQCSDQKNQPNTGGS